MARNYPKVAKPFCDPPARYAGRLYYRVQPNLTAIYPEWLKVAERDQAHAAVLGDRRNQDRGVLTSGLVLDEAGILRSEWQTPVKYNYQPEKQPYEFNGTVMTERVRDVIEAFEPTRHILIPMDCTAPDGKVARWYRRMSGESFLYSAPPPALHPVLNQLEAYRYTNGTIGFTSPAGHGSADPAMTISITSDN